MNARKIEKKIKRKSTTRTHTTHTHTDTTKVNKQEVRTYCVLCICVNIHKQWQNCLRQKEAFLLLLFPFFHFLYLVVRLHFSFLHCFFLRVIFSIFCFSVCVCFVFCFYWFWFGCKYTCDVILVFLGT